MALSYVNVISKIRLKPSILHGIAVIAHTTVPVLAEINYECLCSFLAI